jgi:hypothetical protein
MAQLCQIKGSIFFSVSDMLGRLRMLHAQLAAVQPSRHDYGVLIAA